MIENRTVPVDTVLPHVVYEDVSKAMEWLTKAFGFEEHFHYGEPAQGAQMHLGNAWVMLREARGGASSPAKLGYGTQSVTVFLEDVEGHCRRSKAAGAKIVEEPHETEYGEFQYAALDLDGHHWVFARHAKDMSPADWGAKLVKPVYRLSVLPKPRFCYLEIPASDARRSAEFYEKVFGWNIRHRDREQPSFDDAAGVVSGMWVSNRKSSGDKGILPSIMVDDIDGMLARVKANGGEIVEPAQEDSPGSGCWMAKFRDPGGNELRLYQEGKR